MILMSEIGLLEEQCNLMVVSYDRSLSSNLMSVYYGRRFLINRSRADVVLPCDPKKGA